MRFKAFVASSICLFAVSVTAVWKDFDKEWKHYQVEFNKLEYEETKTELDSLKKSVEGDAEFKKLEATLRASEEKLSSQEMIAKQNELKKEITKLKFQTYLKERDAKFTKSTLDSIEYQIIKATNEKQPTDSLISKKQDLLAVWEKQKVEAKAAGETQAKAETQLKDLSKEYSDLKSKYDEKIVKLDLLEKKLDSVKHRPIEIKQIVLPQLKTVDRCISCHTTIDRDGFEDKKYRKVFQTHPNKDLYLVKHNVKEFGCVSCHQGQGLAITNPDTAHGWVPFWDKPMFEGKQAEASCIKCHKATDDIGADFFNKGKELVNSSNCFACHKLEGQPAGMRNGPPLVQAASKFNPAWMVNWVQNPRHYLPQSKMPTFPIDKEGAKAITAYVMSSSDANYGAKKNIVPNPALAAEGEKLFQAKTCATCHAVRGTGGAVGPDLGRVASKNNPTWIFNWIKNPRSYHPTTIMPNLNLSDNEALAIVSWLQQFKWENMPQEEVNVNDKELASKGKELMKTYGCASCHNVAGLKAEQNCPELTGEAEKDIHKFDFGYAHLDPERGVHHLRESYIYNKVRTPGVYNDFVKGRMPRFWFTDDQTNAVYTYIMGVTGKHESIPYRYIYKPKNVEESNEEIKK